jgi:hypothetical protein
MTWDEALSFCELLLEDIDDLPMEAAEFQAGVRSKVEGMQDWIRDRLECDPYRGILETNQHVTVKMVVALENIRGGVDKWLRR